MIDSFFHFGQAKFLRGVCLLAILGGVFGEASLVLGQSTALLTGTVVDPSGAAVPGAGIVCQSDQPSNEPPIRMVFFDFPICRSGFTTLPRTAQASLPPLIEA
jgi:hypothetical protein